MLAFEEGSATVENLFILLKLIPLGKHLAYPHYYNNKYGYTCILIVYTLKVEYDLYSVRDFYPDYNIFSRDLH